MPNNAVQIEKQVNFHKLCLWLLSFHCRLSKRLIYIHVRKKMNSRSFLVAFTQQLRSLSTIWPHFSESIINWILNNAPKTKMGLFFSPWLFFVQSLWSAIICSNWTQHNNKRNASFKCPTLPSNHFDAKHTGCCYSDLCLRKYLINHFNPPVLHQHEVSGESSLAWLFWWVWARRRRLVYL